MVGPQLGQQPYDQCPNYRRPACITGAVLYAVALALLPGSQACHTTPCASMDTGAHPIMSLLVASLLLLLLAASLIGRRTWHRMRGPRGATAEPLLPTSDPDPSLPASPATPSSQSSDPPSGRVSEMHSLQPNGSARVSKLFRMRHGRRRTAGAIELYFGTALEDAEAYAKHAGTYPRPDGKPPTGYKWDSSIGVWRDPQQGRRGWRDCRWPARGGGPPPRKAKQAMLR